MGAINFFSINGAGSGGGSPVINTDNGVTGDGSVGTPVKLGGKPLTANTDIITNNFQLVIGGVTPAGTNDQILVGTGTDLGLDSFDPVSNDESIVNVTANTSNTEKVVLSYLKSSLGVGMSIKLIDGVGAVVNDDLNNIGISGDQVFPKTNDEQYVQFGNLPGRQVAAQDTAGQTTDQVIPPSYTPTVDSILRINSYGFYRSGTGTVDVSIIYQDVTGGGRSVALGTVSSVNPSSSFPATIIKVRHNTPVIIDYIVTGSIIYDGGGVIENLFT